MLPSRTSARTALALAALLSASAISGCAAEDGAAPAPGSPSVDQPGDTPSTPVPDPAQPADPGAPADPTAPAGPERIYGVTVDDPWRAEETAAALSALPRPVMARVVFDSGVRASQYVGPVGTIAKAGPVMGEILDSFFVKDVSVEGYRARTREYLQALGDRVAVWEIANEINGEWVGEPAVVAAKVRAAHEEVKAAGKKSALTLFGCYWKPEHEMIRWATENLSPELRASLDHVWVSFYEDDCADDPPDWNVTFRKLAELFPNAKLGFGECGTRYADRKVEYLRRWYATEPDAPRFVGGYFWWYFSQDMVPSTKPLFSELSRILAAAP